MRFSVLILPRPDCTETDFTAEMIGAAFSEAKPTSPGLGLELQDQRKSLRRDCLPSNVTLIGFNIFDSFNLFNVFSFDSFNCRLVSL